MCWWMKWRVDWCCEAGGQPNFSLFLFFFLTAHRGPTKEEKEKRAYRATAWGPVQSNQFNCRIDFIQLISLISFHQLAFIELFDFTSFDCLLALLIWLDCSSCLRSLPFAEQCGPRPAHNPPKERKTRTIHQTNRRKLLFFIVHQPFAPQMLSSQYEKGRKGRSKPNQFTFLILKEKRWNWFWFCWWPAAVIHFQFIQTFRKSSSFPSLLMYYPYCYNILFIPFIKTLLNETKRKNWFLLNEEMFGLVGRRPVARSTNSIHQQFSIIDSFHLLRFGHSAGRNSIPPVRTVPLIHSTDAKLIHSIPQLACRSILSLHYLSSLQFHSINSLLSLIGFIVLLLLN